VEVYEGSKYDIVLNYSWASGTRKQIDAYLQTLVDDLYELWNKGVSTYNALMNEIF
jgi:predicted heme/steroid binding protein